MSHFWQTPILLSTPLSHAQDIEDQASTARLVVKQEQASIRLWINPRKQELIQVPRYNTILIPSNLTQITTDPTDDSAMLEPKKELLS